MRTTLDLPEDLLKEAMKTTNINTKTSVIVFALEDLIRREKIKSIKNYHGKLKLNINLNQLRNR